MATPSDPHPSPIESPTPLKNHREATTIAPDVAEQERPPMEGDRPLAAFQDLPVIGLGGSAGSLPALQAFFGKMSPDSGMAFVVILHLLPEEESSLAEILQRTTSMPVTQVRERVKIKPNRVYVIPPARHLILMDGHLGLVELAREAGKRVAVDLFFRTLADTQGPNSGGIVLSGADSDGAIGIKRIKERGGLTIAQDPQEAEHFGMPSAAIGTGMIDWVLPAAEMPARILEFQRAGRRLQLPSADAGEGAAASEETSVRDILALLRVRTGRDFGTYKRGTVMRRITRRMQVNGLCDFAAYHAFLRTNPGEAGALLQDLLISVTNFFRDRDAFHSLEAALPELFKGKKATDSVRVWVAACATGEEAYSIAMLLVEHASRLESPPRIQIFATDLDETALAGARAAHYPETIAADVSEDRLQRFFVRQQSHYRVSQPLRELVLFAAQDLLRDAPFSQLDLVSCRNLLIYLNRESQQRCFELFHFALRAGGTLFLGSSETAEEAGALFTPLDKKYRIYRRLTGSKAGLPVPLGPLTLSLALQAQARSGGKSALPGNPEFAFSSAPIPPPSGMSTSDLHFKLIDTFAPPSLVVDRNHQVVHYSPAASRYLRMSGGEPTRDVLELVHPMLRIDLRAALFRAAETSADVDVAGIPVDLSEGTHLLDLSVRTAPTLGEDHFLVVFNERAAPGTALRAAQPPSEPEGVVRSLERELVLLKHQLRSSFEQHSATTEEMKSANEELQAMNEELRSSAEELETSREELQSMNEELATVNLELKGKVDDLRRANNDVQNLMAATNIPTVFVDCELRIKRYTPSAVTVFHLIPSDLGRPLGDLRHRLEFDTVVPDAEKVLSTLSPLEREMKAANGLYFLVRILPYWSAEGRVEGVVLTLVDISERKRAESARHESDTRFRGIIDQTAVGICLLSPVGTISFSNPRLARMLGWHEADLVGKGFAVLTFPGEDQRVTAGFENLAVEPAPFELEQRLMRKDGTSLWASLSVSGLRDKSGELIAAVGAIIDVTARKSAEESLVKAHGNLERRVEERTQDLNRVNAELRAEIAERERAQRARVELMQALVNAQENERGRISRELHDGVGQQLTALLLDLKSLERNLEPHAAATAQGFQKVRKIADKIGDELKQAAMELRPMGLDDLGLVRALTAFLAEWSARAGITLHFDDGGMKERRLPPLVEITLYRAVGEGVHNVLRHSGAKNINVILQEADGLVSAIIEDDGTGFDTAILDDASKRARLGLVGMRERLAMIDGTLAIDSEVGRGTTLIARVPVASGQTAR